MKHTILRLLSVLVCITMLAVTTPEFTFRPGIAEGLSASPAAPDVTDAANDAVQTVIPEGSEATEKPAEAPEASKETIDEAPEETDTTEEPAAAGTTPQATECVVDAQAVPECTDDTLNDATNATILPEMQVAYATGTLRTFKGDTKTEEISTAYEVNLIENSAPGFATVQLVKTGSTSNANGTTYQYNMNMTGVANGTTTVKLYYEYGDNQKELLGSYVIIVTNPVRSISLNTYKCYLDLADTLKLTATPFPADADDLKIIWSTSNPSVATVDPAGNVTLVSAGLASITATSRTVYTTAGSYYVLTVTAVCKVNVCKKSTSFEIAEDSVRLENGVWEYQLGVRLEPSDSTYHPTWQISDSSVVTMDENGRLYAHKDGEAVITATMEDSGLTDSVTVVVQGYVPVQDVMLSSQSTLLTTEGRYPTAQLTANVLPANASQASVIWTSSDDNIVSVDETGLLTAKGTGTATITAKVYGSNCWATCAVEVIRGVSTVRYLCDYYSVNNNSWSFGTYCGDATYLYGDPFPFPSARTGERITSVRMIGSHGAPGDPVSVDYMPKTDVDVCVEYEDIMVERVTIEGLSEVWGNYKYVTLCGTYYPANAKSAVFSLVTDNGNVRTEGNTRYGGNYGEYNLTLEICGNGSSTIAVREDGGWESWPITITVTGYGTSQMSVSSSGGNLLGAPALSLVNVGSDFKSVSLAWSAVTGATSYMIYRYDRFTGSSMVQIAEVPADQTTYTYAKDYNVAFNHYSGTWSGVYYEDLIINYVYYVCAAKEVSGNKLVGNKSNEIETSCRKVTKITPMLSKLIVGAGDSSPAVALAYEPADATLQKVRWVSSNSAVAQVDEKSGSVSGIKVGTCTITAYAKDSGGAKATISVSVVKNGQQVYGVSLDKKSLTLGLNEKSTLKATVTPKQAVDKSIVWVSGNPQVATVSASGVVSGIAEGQGNIYAYSSGGIYAVCTVTVKKFEVTGVLLKDTKLTVTIGDKRKLAATIQPSNAYDKTLVWSSSNSTVVTVDQTGATCAVGIGTAAITAKSTNEKTASCTFTVKPVYITKLSLNETSKSITLKKGDSLGNTVQLSARITPSNATIKDLKWTSSNTKVVVVDDQGLVTIVGYGSATITGNAKDGSGKKATCKFAVSEVKVSKVKLSASASVITVPANNEFGKTVQLRASITPSNAHTQALAWSSSNVKVATVDQNGEVTAVGYGTTTITAKSTDGTKKSGTFKVTVQPQYVTTAKLSGLNTMKPGTQQQLTALVLPEDANNKTVEWSTSSKSIATVDQNGIVTAKKAGTVKITVTAKDGSKVKAVFTIKIK